MEHADVPQGREFTHDPRPGRPRAALWLDHGACSRAVERARKRYDEARAAGIEWRAHDARAVMAEFSPGT